MEGTMRALTVTMAIATCLALSLTTSAIMLLAALTVLTGTGIMALQDSRTAK